MKSLETSRGFMSQSRRHKPLGDLSWGSISSPPLRFGGYGCGNRILRDPYERLVAQFRGTYRLEHPELLCDVDAGVKMMLQNYLAEVQAGNPWAENCNYLPQAEFFDQPFGGTIFVDNRHFPDSMNEDFELLCKHFGYCDRNESICLKRVPEMCPPQLFDWNSEKEMYEVRQSHLQSTH
eukprot:g22710.t1